MRNPFFRHVLDMLFPLPTSVAADARLALILLVAVFTALTILRWNNLGAHERNGAKLDPVGDPAAAPSDEARGESVQALAKASGSFLDYLRSLDDKGLTEFTKETSYREPEFWLSQRAGRSE